MGKFNKDKTRRGGKSCVAGGSKGFSCTNTVFTDVLSMHTFPSKTKDPKRHNKWVKFVRKHRSNWMPHKDSVLCSEHFELTCFSKNPSIAKSLGMRLRLQQDAVPSIDAAPDNKEPSKEYSAREKRKVFYLGHMLLML